MIAHATPQPDLTPLCYGYLRVSTFRQAKYGDSLKEQPERILEYYERNLKPEGIAWGGIVTERPISAKRVMFNLRPEGKALLAILKSGDHVVFDSLSRAFRNMRDLCNTIYDMEKIGVVLHFRDVGVDIRTPAGRMLTYAAGMGAEMSSSILSERIKDWHAYRKAKGIRRKMHKKQPLDIIKRVVELRHEGFGWVEMSIIVNREIALSKGQTFKGKGRFDQWVLSFNSAPHYYRQGVAMGLLESSSVAPESSQD